MVGIVQNTSLWGTVLVIPDYSFKEYKVTGMGRSNGGLETQSIHEINKS